MRWNNKQLQHARRKREESSLKRASKLRMLSMQREWEAEWQQMRLRNEALKNPMVRLVCH